jgi:hypothetical protein
MEKEIGVEQSLGDVPERFLHHFAEIFGYHDMLAVPEQSGDLNVLNDVNDLNS